MTIGHQLGLRLFLEGVECPVIGVSISIAQDTPVAASIQVVATDKVLELLPRTLVHLFFYDFVDAAYPLSSTTTYSSAQEEFNAKYKLLFMGEVQGIAFQKDTGSRAAVLQCVDLSNYWDTTYQYNFGGELLGGRQQAAFIGANTTMFNSPLGHGVGTFAMLANSKSVNFPELKGLLAGVVRCLEAIGGCYYGETTFKGASLFTSIAELRLKILQQIVAAEKDSSTAKLFARKTFNMWMNRQMGSLGKLVTFRGVVQIMQQFVFHTIFPCPVAKYQEAEVGIKKTKTWATDLAKDPSCQDFVKKIKELRALLMSAKNNLTNYPASVSDAQQQQPSSLKETVKGLKDLGRYITTGKLPKQTTAKTISSSATATALRNDLDKALTIVQGLNSGGVPKVAGLSSTYKSVSSNFIAGSNVISRGRDSAALGDMAKRTATGVYLDGAIAGCDIILGTRIKHQRDYTLDKLERVNNQILRPDIWFVPAPRCNVLFPELYQSFQWSRNFLREVSRMELQTTNEILGDDALFNGRYYAPNVKDMRSGLKLSNRRFSQLILNHELLTGIIPMYEKLSEANLFAMKSSKVSYKGAKVSYAQRSVNHQYFKHRFSSRQMSAEGRFNPWFVPGFPAVLIDRPLTADDLALTNQPVETQQEELKKKGKSIAASSGSEVTRSDLLRLIVPTQYFGCCTQITHTLNQQGGNTQYAFEQARIHREDTEFLGVDKAVVSRKVGSRSAKRKTVGAVSSDSLPKVGGRGPMGGKITSSKDVSKSYAGRHIKLLYGTGKVIVGNPVPGTSKRLDMGTQSTFQLAYGPYTSGPLHQTTSVYMAYEVLEEYTRREKANVDVPIEYAIQPPWIWDGWMNLKIGETYQQFFGIDSITDIEAIGTADQLTSLLEVQEGISQGTMTVETESLDEYLDRTSDEIQVEGEQKSGSFIGANTALANTTDSEHEDDSASQAQKKIWAAALVTVEKERTIEASVDYLVRIYSYLKHYGLDVGEFIRNYTWRPVATMAQILGSTDFTVTEDPAGSGNYTTTGTEGFHSRAFGDVADLFGLVDAKVKKVLGLSKDKSQATAKKLDVRQRRRQAVWAYVSEITDYKALLG